MQPIQLKIFEEQLRAKVIEQFDKAIRENSCSSKLQFNVNVADLVKAQGKKLPRVLFLPEAYTKMKHVIAATTTEVALHGLVDRHDNDFIITDVFFYPQILSGATVTTSNDYDDWCLSLDDDTINRMRFQIHSHVNMGVSPSVVDMTYYAAMLENIQDFYIFMICNKAGAINVILYDKQENMMYETADVDVDVICTGDKLTKWYSDCMATFTSKPVVTTPTTPTTGYPATTSYVPRDYSASRFGDDDDDGYYRGGVSHYIPPAGGYGTFDKRDKDKDKEKNKNKNDKNPGRYFDGRTKEGRAAAAEYAATAAAACNMTVAQREQYMKEFGVYPEDDIPENVSFNRRVMRV